MVHQCHTAKATALGRARSLDELRHGHAHLRQEEVELGNTQLRILFCRTALHATQSTHTLCHKTVDATFGVTPWTALVQTMRSGVAA